MHATQPSLDELETVLALPSPFHLFRLVSGSDHLHFGYFLSEDQTIFEAQDKMMRLNLMFLRRGDQRVLDVGSGLGATARVLAERGLEVTALCPDSALISYSRRWPIAPLSGSVEWVCGRFEDYRSPRPFDLVLFQESFQYFDEVEVTLRRASELLRPGGRLVVGDQFLNENRPRSQARFHPISVFLAIARRVGFRVHTHCDISAGAARAIDWMLERLQRDKRELVERYADRLPNLERDIADMQRSGNVEREAYASGHLSYRVLAFDR